MSVGWQGDMFLNPTYDSSGSSDIQPTPANLFDFNFDFAADTTQSAQLGNGLFLGDESNLDSRDTSAFESPQLLPSNPSQSASEASHRSSPSAPNLCTHQELSRAPSPAPFIEASSSIDQVLITNKAEIENAYSLLACDCSHNPHFALTLALICSKISLCSHVRSSDQSLTAVEQLVSQRMRWNHSRGLQDGCRKRGKNEIADRGQRVTKGQGTRG